MLSTYVMFCLVVWEILSVSQSCPDCLTVVDEVGHEETNCGRSEQGSVVLHLQTWISFFAERTGSIEFYFAEMGMLVSLLLV